MSLKSLIDKPKELEKKKYGEVFTPMKIVNEMLDKLDECYKKEHKNSIFTKKSFKWLDPANGMGNYPIAVYLRLMEGLKKKYQMKRKERNIFLKICYI